MYKILYITKNERYDLIGTIPVSNVGLERVPV